jgi:hypothetical protein
MRRLLATALFVTSSALLASCGGGAGSGGAMPPGAQPFVGGNPSAASMFSPAPRATIAASTSIATAGTVGTVESGKFELDQPNNGWVWVSDPSGTLVIGGSITKGQYAQVTGTGSPDSTVSAEVVTLWSSPPPSITATGTIVASTAYGFTLDVSAAYPAVPIVLTSGTVIGGGALEIGATATVSGIGSQGESITAVQIAVTDPTPEPLPTSTPLSIPDDIATQGTIGTVESGKFELDQPNNGWVWVSDPSGTLVIGGSITKGQYAQVTGTGSPDSTVSAEVVTLWSSPPGNLTASGTLVAGTAYGFTLDVSAQYAAVPILVNSATVIAGGSLVPGAQVTVSGAGSLSESITPVQISVVDTTPPPSAATPTPSPISQQHVLTKDYLYIADGSTTVSPSQAAPYLNWAESTPAYANSIAAARIRVQMYVDPNRTEPGQSLYTSDRSTFAQACSGTVVTDLYKGSLAQYVMNPSSTDLQALFHNTMVSEIGSTDVSQLFVDDSGPLSDFTSTPFSPSLPCGYTDAQWTSGGIALDNAAPLPVVINGLNALDGHNPSLGIGLLAGSNTVGGNFEGCYSDSDSAENDGWLWAATENTELEVNAMSKSFSCLSTNLDAASSSIPSRLYTLASFLLSYNPATSVLWEEFATPSNFHVFPEAQLVPLDPVNAAPTSVSGLLAAGGAYARQYNECFLAGNFVGPCAVVVNPDSSAPVVFPYPQYHHTLVISGNGVLDGGSVATNGPPPPTYLPALGSAIVFP